MNAVKIWAEAVRETGIWESPLADQVAALGRLVIPRMQEVIRNERDARLWAEGMLRKKDAAMSTLFERLANAGVDVSDLIS